ncbi:cupin domain-containing protein [Chryseobacterium sp. LC2016-27]|uniref:cupin domain-containing protein n=1 Tax=Chryseobacterium sp. LC2016-27 TaxID=2897326 RepID=UPI001E60AEB9|nr:cupin domain-containing protein [Chryseobacterium sp. LC2016-27]MCD0455917.1 cupin domain-containing protein [Chryseobacterium sp. LC2016-27]
MKYLHCITILSSCLLMLSTHNFKSQTQKTDEPEFKTLFEKGGKLNSENFTGTVYLKMLITNDKENPVTVGNVTFEAGARTNWHLHPTGQILLVTNGTGYYQEKEQPKKIVRKGDVIKCLPNVEHWHGASVDSHFSHLAISNNDKGSVVWLLPVSDEVYHK